MYAAWALIVAVAGNADEIDLDVIVGTRVPAIGPLIAQLSVRKEVAGTRTVSDYLKSVRRELSLNSRLQTAATKKHNLGSDPGWLLGCPAQLMVQVVGGDDNRNGSSKASDF
jgi:hypothetical protein